MRAGFKKAGLAAFASVAAAVVWLFDDDQIFDPALSETDYTAHSPTHSPVGLPGIGASSAAAASRPQRCFNYLGYSRG